MIVSTRAPWLLPTRPWLASMPPASVGLVGLPSLGHEQETLQRPFGDRFIVSARLAPPLLGKGLLHVRRRGRVLDPEARAGAMAEFGRATVAESLARC